MRATAVAAAAATVGGLGLLAFGRSPDAVERLYVEGAGPRIQGAITAVSGHLPGISLAEWAEVGGIAAGIGWFAATLWLLWRGAGRRRWLLARAGAQLWLAGAVIGLVFYTTWGLAYARPKVEVRFGWIRAGDALAPITDDELADLGDELVDKVNGLYLGLHRWPDAYRETRPHDGGHLPDGTAREALAGIDREIDRAYDRVVAELGLHPTVGWARGPAKPLVTSVAFSYLGIGGFYFPFTAEANIDVDAPQWGLPHTVAHEKAHQRFVASENEANFYGFLACIHADDPFVRYGGWLFAQRQVLAALRGSAPTRFRRGIARRYPGVQRDVNFSHAFWTGYDGPVGALGEAVNDRYLRLNGVEGGVHSYSRSVSLVVEWLRRTPAADRPYAGR